MRSHKQGINKLLLYIYTVKYLRFTQVYYQFYYIVKKKLFKKHYYKEFDAKTQPIIWESSFKYQNSYSGDITFEFLNQTHKFKEEIDWNFSKYGKLWTFNLNYFDFLNQKNISKEEGLQLIGDYIDNHDTLIEGKESYTISLRGINWTKFLSKHKVINEEINQALYNDYYRLYHNLELHFLGNHYLENGFSLLFGAYYFQDDKLYKAAKKILIKELEEQILKDGAHFELSPMYHQTILHRVLDCFNLVQANAWRNQELGPFLKEKAIRMLSWLQAVTFDNDIIPMVNDSAYNIAPTSDALFSYAKSLGLKWIKGTLSDSGYRKIKNKNYELFMDVGHVGASYQPAHVHSDTCNFELYVKGKPLIIDTGTSTYEKNEKRQLERSTASHNTVKIGNFEQSEVWSGFRVAERAKIVNLNDSKNTVEATHDGYKKLGILHTRKFTTNNDSIIIRDMLSKDSHHQAKLYLHFHPDVKNIEQKDNKIELVNENIIITFSEDAYKLNITDFNYAMGFNKTVKSKKIEICFKSFIETQIHL